MKLSYSMALGLVSGLLSNEAALAQPSNPCPNGGTHDPKNFMCVKPAGRNLQAFAAGKECFVKGKKLDFYPSCTADFYFSKDKNPGMCQACDAHHTFDPATKTCVVPTNAQKRTEK